MVSAFQQNIAEFVARPKCIETVYWQNFLANPKHIRLPWLESIRSDILIPTSPISVVLRISLGCIGEAAEAADNPQQIKMHDCFNRNRNHEFNILLLKIASGLAYWLILAPCWHCASDNHCHRNQAKQPLPQEPYTPTQAPGTQWAGWLAGWLSDPT